jgi:hypothetical protein
MLGDFNAGKAARTQACGKFSECLVMKFSHVRLTICS